MAIPGQAVLAAEKVKFNHYNRRYDIPDGQLVPFALDTWGSMGAHAIRFLQFVAYEASEPTSTRVPLPYARRFRLLQERVAVVLQVANAEIVRVMRTQLAAGVDGLQAAGVGPGG
jgi:hypothetical protein